MSWSIAVLTVLVGVGEAANVAGKADDWHHVWVTGSVERCSRPMAGWWRSPFSKHFVVTGLWPKARITRDSGINIGARRLEARIEIEVVVRGPNGSR